MLGAGATSAVDLPTHLPSTHARARVVACALRGTHETQVSLWKVFAASVRVRFPCDVLALSCVTQAMSLARPPVPVWCEHEV